LFAEAFENFRNNDRETRQPPDAPNAVAGPGRASKVVCSCSSLAKRSATAASSSLSAAAPMSSSCLLMALFGAAHNSPIVDHYHLRQPLSFSLSLSLSTSDDVTPVPPRPHIRAAAAPATRIPSAGRCLWSFMRTKGVKATPLPSVVWRTGSPQPLALTQHLLSLRETTRGGGIFLFLFYNPRGRNH
jgi:hypothetical protein